MIRIQNMAAILYKQFLDTLKNMHILLLFFIFPLVAFVMLTATGEQTGMQAFFISTFASMHCIFASIVSTASILSEEKEKNTLRILILSGVKPAEYLCSIGSFVVAAVLITGCPFLFMGKYDLQAGCSFLLLLLLGAVVSVLLGTCIGLLAPNAAAANATAVPVSMLFAFLPMLAFFNESIQKVAEYTYTYQISRAMQNMEQGIDNWGILILTAGIYLAAFVGLFSFLFHKKKWE